MRVLPVDLKATPQDTLVQLLSGIDVVISAIFFLLVWTTRSLSTMPPKKRASSASSSPRSWSSCHREAWTQNEVLGIVEEMSGETLERDYVRITIFPSFMHSGKEE